MNLLKLNVNNKIVYFDGVCGLCNRSVDFLLRIDKEEKKLLFTTLQGNTARANLKIMPGQNFNTIIFQQNGKLYYRSDAFIKILKTIGGFWNIIVVIEILPKSVRDYFYNLIAGNRYKWFGKRDTCRMPTKEERERFLD